MYCRKAGWLRSLEAQLRALAAQGLAGLEEDSDPIEAECRCKGKVGRQKCVKDEKIATGSISKRCLVCSPTTSKG